MAARNHRVGVRGPPSHRARTPKPPSGLPADVRFYRRTDVFTEASAPEGLRKSHATRDGVWGLIHVLEGELAYRVTDPRRPASAIALTPDTGPGVVEPTIAHEVEPLGAVRFYVEFHRRFERGA